jgi:hypothetical protein
VERCLLKTLPTSKPKWLSCKVLAAVTLACAAWLGAAGGYCDQYKFPTCLHPEPVKTLIETVYDDYKPFQRPTKIYYYKWVCLEDRERGSK